jgi:SSS family solute:Na+ symporter
VSVLSSSFAVVVYVVVLIFVAIRARAAREYEEFSVAKRALPLALIFGSIAATYVGPGFSIGFVGRGFKSGFLFLVVGLAYAVQNILVGLLVAPRLRALKDCYTLGDAIGQKYDRKCHILAGVISLGLCTGFSAVMINAGGVVLNDILGLPPWLSVCIVASVTASYTTFGGLRASVITDAFHFALFALLLPTILLFALLFHPNGSAATFFNEAFASTADGFNSTPPIKIVSLVTAFLLGETLIPPYANLALASKTTKVSRNGFILAGIFSTVWFTVMIALGILARSIVPKNTAEDYVLLNLVKSIMPSAGYSLLLVALVSIVLSSLDSLLNAGAVVFTQDIVKPFAKLSDRTALNIGRRATVVIAAIAAVGALFVPSIISGLLICYTIWAPAILPALIIGLWLKCPRPLAGILSMGVGTFVAIMFQFIPPLADKVPAIIPALGSAILAYALGHWIKPSTNCSSGTESKNRAFCTISAGKAGARR